MKSKFLCIYVIDDVVLQDIDWKNCSSSIGLEIVKNRQY